MIGAIRHRMRNGKLVPQERSAGNREVGPTAGSAAEPSTPHLLRAICINPRHQRPRCVMYSETPSGARPMLSRSFRYAVFQPDSFSLSDSSISSVTLSVGKPPTLAARDRGGAAAECHAPGVLGGEQHIEEEALFVGPSARSTKAVLQRVGVKEVLRRLDATDLLVPKQRQRATEELWLRDKIGVENGYVLARVLVRKLPQRVVDIARLRMLIVRAGDVPDVAPFTELPQPIAAPVIQNEDAVVIVIL